MEDPGHMNRREALSRLMAITGTVMIGAELFVTGCRSPDAAERTVPLTAAELALLDEIAETIIPTTDTPGAKAAGVGPFMAATAKDCYDDASYESFRGGLAKVDAASRKRNGKPFIESTPGNWVIRVTAKGSTQVLAESAPIRVDALWIRTVLLLDAPGGGIKITPLGEQ